MSLQQQIEEFIALRRALGQKYVQGGYTLRAFGRAMGEGIDITDVRPEKVNAFLAGNGHVTRTWLSRYGVLAGFYEHAISCGYVDESSLPPDRPRIPKTFVPYIFSSGELRRLLQSVESYQRHYHRSLESATVRIIVLLIYGTGLRCSEAIGLNHADVNLKECVLIIRATKFNKQRLVPFSRKLGEALSQYAGDRGIGSRTTYHGDNPFFTTRQDIRVVRDTLERNFRVLCNHAGIRRTDGAKLQPRLHDLRHTFAVHRLTEWYREGADVQKLLPQLSVYLGHVRIECTQVYLSMTPELLRQASNRFERYFMEGRAHE